MSASEGPDSLPGGMERCGVGVGMVVWRHEMRVVICSQVIDHVHQSARFVEIVVLGKINYLGVVLRGEQIDLPAESGAISDAREGYQGQIRLVEIILEELFE